MILELKNGVLYISDYEIKYDKKRKKELLDVKNTLKINNLYIKHCDLSEGQILKVVVLSNEETTSFNDEKFNKNINKSIFVFEEGTGVRLFI